jgi:hypothetical protein
MVFAPLEDHLYARLDGEWNVYSMEGGQAQRVYKWFRYAGIIATTPTPLHHATVYQLEPDQYVLSGFGLDTPTAPEETPPSTLAEAIAALPAGSRWAVSCYDATDNGIGVAQAIRDGTAIAISDGSFKEDFGTSALVIEASDSTDNIIAVNVVPGNLDNQGSYRSELAGIFGQITLVNALCNVHGITQGSIECGRDGVGALNKVFNPDSEAKTDGSQFNLLSATRAALKASPI